MEFIETGVPNLDFVLGGGLAPGSLTMVVGRPGSGKTILSQQIAFHHARNGKRTLVLTTLPEPHVKLLSNLRTLSFFDEGLLGDRVELINVYRPLREDFAGAGTTIVRLAREFRADLVVIDSYDSIRSLATDETGIKELTYELSAGLGLLGVSVIVVSALEPGDYALNTELAIADHIITLRSEVQGARGVRTLEVPKMRGAAQRLGLHAYEIDGRGMSVHPRQESVPLPAETELGNERVPFGLPELDAMMGGGPPRGSSTTIVGNPGTGKTLLALQFLLDGHRQGERGLFISFHETEQQLVAKASGLGLELPSALNDGFEFIHRVPAEFDPDEVALIVRERIARDGIRRLVVDGLDELLGGLLDRERRLGFLTSLLAYLRNTGVTSCLIEEVSAATGGAVGPGSGSLSAYADNIVLLRHLTHDAALHRVVSILKMRSSDHDRTLREFTIGSGGLSILTAIESDSGVLDALGQL